MLKYNTHQKTYEDLKGSFVGRWDIFNDLIDELRLPPGGTPVQHWMFHGPRGIGKTHLMVLVYHEVKHDPELCAIWIPVRPPEELRLQKGLCGLLEKVVSVLCGELEAMEYGALAREIQAAANEIKKMKPAAGNTGGAVDKYFELIDRAREETGRRILLLAENMQEALGKRTTVSEQKMLRAYLQTSDSLLIIGTATTVFEALVAHSVPFYNFFRLVRLEELGVDDMKKLVAGAMGKGKASDSDMKKLDPRMKTIYAFTGGNPRLAVFMGDILSASVADKVSEIMEELVDELTPYFEVVFKDVPEHQRDIINVLAEYDPPAQSPSDIAAALGAPPENIRNYMIPLKDNGFIRIALSEGRNNYYILREYLYRIWYQMRNGLMTERNRWLVEFMLLLYTNEELEHKKLEICGPDFDICDRRVYVDAIMDACEYKDTRPDEYKKFNMLRENIQNEYRVGGSIRNVSNLNDVLGLMREKEYKQALIEIDNTADEWANCADCLVFWGICLTMLNYQSEAIEKYSRAIELYQDYDRIFAKEHILVCYGRTLMYFGKTDEATRQFLSAIDVNPKCHEAYLCIGYVLHKDKKHIEAITWIKKALEIQPDNEMLLEFLGTEEMFAEKYEDAFITATSLIKISPSNAIAYYILGQYYFITNNIADARVAFERSVLIDNSNGNALLLLGACNVVKNNIEEGILFCMKGLGWIDKVSLQVGIFFVNALLPKLNPDDYARMYYGGIYDKKFTDAELCSLLMVSGRTDVVRDYIGGKMKKEVGDQDKAVSGVKMLRVAAALRVFICLTNSDVNGAADAAGVLAEILLAEGEKGLDIEDEIRKFVNKLFVMHAGGASGAEGVSAVLEKLKSERDRGLPYQDVIDVLWKCISAPESLDARRHMQDRAIASTVELIKNEAAVMYSNDEKDGNNIAGIISGLKT